MIQRTWKPNWGVWGTMMAVIAGVVVSTGCSTNTPPRMNAPPQGQSINPHDLREPWVAMTDNALLNERAMSSCHFVPQSRELNGVGVRRLTRYASILKVYGGTLYYDGEDKDPQMRLDRLSEMEEFLLACGLEEGSFEVEAGIGGGAGMKATEASSIREATRGPGTVEIEYGGSETTSME